MLSIVQALKEFRTIVLGYPIVVSTDHRNLTHNDTNFKTARVMRWRLAIEEYMPTIEYIPGEKNVVADLFSRIPITPQDDDDELYSMEEIFDLPREYNAPVNLQMIHTAQLKDKHVQRLQREAPHRLGLLFDNAGEREPHQAITLPDPTTGVQRIIVPDDIKPKLLQWYHSMLCHPGATRLFNTLYQHYTWKGMRNDIINYCKTCHSCQLGKRGMKGYGKIPLKDIETQPWRDVCVDLSGPWETTINNKTETFHALTLIDPFTSWVEIVPIKSKEAPHIRQLILTSWLHRYPRPSRIIFDQGSEFENDWFYSLCARWHIKPEPITVRNPRANAIVERMHQILGDMLRCSLTKRFKHDDPVATMLSAAAYGIRATVHGTTLYTPGQLVFSKDMVLRTHIEADIELLRQRRRQAATINNARENKRRIAYQYKPGDRVLILAQRLDPKMKQHEGPYRVIDYNSANGTLQIRRNNYIESINIRLVRPYFGRHSGGD
mmetsp:Transcript_119887/g.346396  ORF Transcript_119887/g.346396 Transcript_119887/m.346396 type:complete len:492 (-) Transcript_119887:104-1579(-)